MTYKHTYHARIRARTNKHRSTHARTCAVCMCLRLCISATTQHCDIVETYACVRWNRQEYGYRRYWLQKQSKGRHATKSEDARVLTLESWCSNVVMRISSFMRACQTCVPVLLCLRACVSTCICSTPKERCTWPKRPPRIPEPPP